MRVKKKRTSKRVLLCLGVFYVVFISVMIWLFYIRGAVPDTLIQYTLGAGGVEVLAMALIEMSKVKAGDKPGENVSNLDTERGGTYE